MKKQLSLILCLYIGLAPTTFASQPSGVTHMIADWIAAHTAQEAIDYCNAAINTQSDFAGLSFTQLQALLGGQSCEDFITAISTQ